MCNKHLAHALLYRDFISDCKKTDKKIEIAFVLDCTSSMRSYIDAARNSINNLIAKLQSSMESEVKVAIVIYTDLDGGNPNRFQILQFNSDPNVITQHIDSHCKYV